MESVKLKTSEIISSIYEKGILALREAKGFISKEIWKDIELGNVTYGVSNKGQVKSYDETIIGKNDNKYIRKGKILNQTVDKGGYARIQLGDKKNRKMYSVHRLVAILFIPNTENKPIVNHDNCDKLYNCDENLEWFTYKENSEHAKKHGRSKGKTKKVVMLNRETGDFIKSFKSCAKAARFVNSEGKINSMAFSIRGCCKNNDLTAYGYKWKFFEENKNLEENII